ncbi:MAG: peptidylprolyl isomerase [Steroidobacteraceae bacterium]|jgi:peptidyl-prolyl cis-trans isomerase C
MRLFLKAPLGALVAAVTLLAACNKAPENATPATTTPAAPVVAIVNGVSLTRPEFDIYEKNLLRNAKVQSLTPDQQNQVLDDLITMQVMAAQAEKDGLDKDPDTQAQLALLHMRVLADAESQKFVKSQTPSDADLHAEYETAISQMDKNEYHARHILVASKDQADQIIKKLKGGAKFEDLAKAQSTDTGSKNNGGDLGWFTTSRMVKPFADAVKTLKKGEVSPTPVQTQYGWHVIQLEDTRDAAPPPFDQVKPQLTDAVMRKKLQAYVEDLKKQAKVEKKPDALPAPAPAPAAAAPTGPAMSGSPAGSATPPGATPPPASAPSSTPKQ